jgi:glycosyltransferase involved in cell wall biosynthesis
LHGDARSKARVTVVTAGHLSTCPRMLKAADALAAAGYAVHVIATRHEAWATVADGDVRSRRDWAMTVVDYRRQGGAATYWWTGAQHRAARLLARVAGVDRVPFAIAARAFSRVHAALVDAILSAPADLIYGATTGALAAVAEAGRRSRTAYAIDLEDFHSAETSGADAPFIDALAARVERSILENAAFVTASSEAIAAEYHRSRGVEAVVIHNAFPLPSQPPDFTRADPSTLRFFWFSQTIGAGRGLEQAVAAIGRVGLRAELTLVGRPDGSFVEDLSRTAHATAPNLRIVHHPPVPPDTMIDVARGHDVGLALELGPPRNREICLSNKALTYILAGMPVLLADTDGQHAFGVELGRGAALVNPRDGDGLADAIRRWADDPAALHCAKQMAWHCATRRWHFEHDAERGVLYRLVAEALS